MRGKALAAVVFATALIGWAAAAEPTAARRGETALLGRHFTVASVPLSAYDNVWRVWDPKAKAPPADYAKAFMARYGLHPAPYPNNGYPMGLRLAPGLLGKGLSFDCMFCHGGAILGQSHVGLGNTTLDFQAMYEELAAAIGQPRRPPYTFCNVRGTTEAGAAAVFLLGMREPDLSLRAPRIDLGLRDDLCEDVPAWWLLKKKKTMYYTGGADAHSVRSLMQFMMSPLNTGTSIKREEATFADVQEYLLSLEAPKYPFAVDAARAKSGEALFVANCARCHGTYGAKPTYPNKVIPLDEIGTDATRFHGISATFADYYNRSWFAEKSKAVETDGYQAPPLDGVWATAPYFHNGSAPTAYHVLNSKARPKVFTRSYGTGREDYDERRLGWKVRVLDRAPGDEVPGIERRKVYDTTRAGRGNGGHTFGDKLTEEERMAVIEYLKTL